MARSPRGQGLMLAALLLFAWGAGACSGTAAREGEAADPLQTAVDEYLAGFVEGRNFSGVVLVDRAGEVLVSRGYGFANQEHSVANEAGTRFQVGSISKSFTAAGVLLLKDEGRLGLEDPLARFLPDFPRGEEITIHHLLAHESGLPRFVFLPDYAERKRRPHTAADLVDWIRDEPLLFEPGERSAYSNANYAVLARVIERVSEQGYGDFLRARILDPLGLDDSGHRGDARAIVYRMASGYAPVGLRDLVRSEWHDHSVATGAGSLYSTTGDLLEWYRGLASDRLLSESSRDSMFGPEDGDGGYAWRRDDQDGRVSLSTRGWDGVGFSALLAHYPAESVTVVVLCNLNISGITAEAARGVAALTFGEEPDRLELRSEPLEETSLASYAGLYRFGADFYVPNTTMRLVAAEGALRVAATPGGRAGGLLPLSENEFLYRQHWSRVSFERDETGAVTAMNYGRFTARKEPEG